MTGMKQSARPRHYGLFARKTTRRVNRPSQMPLKAFVNKLLVSLERGFRRTDRRSKHLSNALPKSRQRALMWLDSPLIRIDLQPSNRTPAKFQTPAFYLRIPPQRH